MNETIVHACTAVASIFDDGIDNNEKLMNTEQQIANT